MSRQLVCLAIWSLTFSATTCLAFGQTHFPRPGEEVCELVSELSVVKGPYSDRCCAVDGELLFLPGPSSEIKPVIEGFWARRRAPMYVSQMDIGPAPEAPGEYLVLIGLMFEGRFDLLSSNIDTFDITLVDPNH